jgi:tetratricopeptide (TPR) repeat protein
MSSDLWAFAPLIHPCQGGNRLPIIVRTTILFLGFILAIDGYSLQGPARSGAPRADVTGPQNEIDQIAREAQDAYGKQDWEKAIQGFEKLAKLAPNVAEYHSNLGIACYSAGRPQDAVQPLRRALKLKPGLAQAHFYLAASLGETGQCREALPYLKKDLARVTDRPLKRTLGLGGVRCAVALGRLDDSIEFIQALNRDFPDDPEVLYRTVHLYSDLSTRASEQLLYRGPTSYQVRMLNAESLEAQGKWEEAEKEYRKVLEQNPNLPGIHYRLGRLILSMPETAATKEDPHKEFEQELQIDPRNAAAEFILGELDLPLGKTDEAIGHFSRAVKNDDSFVDAFLELGRALTSIGKAAEALGPLEAAVKLQPENPMTHFRLSTAYARVGRREDGQKEMATYRELSEKERQAKETIRKTISGVPPEKPQ